MGYTEDSKLIE